MVEIIESNLSMTGTLRKNIINTCIIVDHSGEKYSDIYDLDRKDKSSGKPMFTHHYLVKKNGYIFRGRNEELESHIDTKFGFNVIGIMVEGNFDVEYMNRLQLNNLLSLIDDITSRNEYILNNVYIHSEVNKDFLSPGRLFPFVEFKNRMLKNYVNSATNCINVRGDVVYSLGSRTLEYKTPNIKGDDVYALKLNMIKIGCSIKNVNNIFDTELENQVRLLQKTNKLYDNGIVDTVFYSLIESLMDKEILNRSEQYQRYLKIEASNLTGNDIKLIKSKLSSLNYYKGINDNVYNESLKFAVIKFQEDMNIESNGEIGPLTFYSIMQSKDYSFKRVLELTDPIMQGSDIQIMQEKLYSKGYIVDTNGYYDNRTRKAICQYQLDNNYLIDGKVDLELFEQILN